MSALVVVEDELPILFAEPRGSHLQRVYVDGVGQPEALAAVALLPLALLAPLGLGVAQLPSRDGRLAPGGGGPLPGLLLDALLLAPLVRLLLTIPDLGVHLSDVLFAPRDVPVFLDDKVLEAGDLSILGDQITLDRRDLFGLRLDLRFHAPGNSQALPDGANRLLVVRPEGDDQVPTGGDRAIAVMPVEGVLTDLPVALPLRVEPVHDDILVVLLRPCARVWLEEEHKLTLELKVCGLVKHLQCNRIRLSQLPEREGVCDEDLGLLTHHCHAATRMRKAATRVRASRVVLADDAERIRRAGGHNGGPTRVEELAISLHARGAFETDERMGERASGLSAPRAELANVLEVGTRQHPRVADLRRVVGNDAMGRDEHGLFRHAHPELAVASGFENGLVAIPVRAEGIGVAVLAELLWHCRLALCGDLLALGRAEVAHDPVETYLGRGTSTPPPAAAAIGIIGRLGGAPEPCLLGVIFEPCEDLGAEAVVGDEGLVLQLHVGQRVRGVFLEPLDDGLVLIGVAGCCDKGVLHDILGDGAHEHLRNAATHRSAAAGKTGCPPGCCVEI
mmetsp:Transcript_174066/g.552657  ORF Transcript_174066/g.552657 Transcript_174066/m.552657 type:complete len:563 (-) Transcript_174066:46-1734(-)